MLSCLFDIFSIILSVNLVVVAVEGENATENTCYTRIFSSMPMNFLCIVISYVNFQSLNLYELLDQCSITLVLIDCSL